MDNADEITNLLAQIAREEAGLSKLSMVKETLQNEVEAKKRGITKSTGCEEKTTGEIHTDKQSTKKGYNTNTHCSVMSINTSHGTNMALTSSSTTHNMSVGETCINGQKQHTVVDNYDPPTVVRNLMGEFHGVTIYKQMGGRG